MCGSIPPTHGTAQRLEGRKGVSGDAMAASNDGTHTDAAGIRIVLCCGRASCSIQYGAVVAAWLYYEE